MKALIRIGIALATIACIGIFAFATMRAYQGFSDIIASHATEPASPADAADGTTDGSPDDSQPSTPSADRLIVRFLDVGQGDCALLSCDGHHMLIDGGPSTDSQFLYSVLKQLGITHMDAIIATHADEDHIGGISAAFNVVTADACYCSVTEDESRTFTNMVRYLEQTSCPLIVPSPNDTLSLGDATVTFLGPDPDHEFEYGEDNNVSLVCRVDYGSTSFLFTGDAEREAEATMIEAGMNLRADVLKVAHHGSSSSTSKQFLEAVRPSVAVISVGADNAFGHPTKWVLDRLAAVGAKVYRTDEDGSIIAISNGRNFTFDTVATIDY